MKCSHDWRNMESKWNCQSASSCRAVWNIWVTTLEGLRMKRWQPLLMHQGPLMSQSSRHSWACSTTMAVSCRTSTVFYSHCTTCWEKMGSGVGQQHVMKLLRKQESCFNNKKVLLHYDTRLPIKLTCDASPSGVGAVISYIMDNGEEEPIAFASRTLSDAERKYAQIESEALVIIYGVNISMEGNLPSSLITSLCSLYWDPSLPFQHWQPYECKNGLSSSWHI